MVTGRGVVSRVKRVALAKYQSRSYELTGAADAPEGDRALRAADAAPAAAEGDGALRKDESESAGLNSVRAVSIEAAETDRAGRGGTDEVLRGNRCAACPIASSNPVS